MESLKTRKNENKIRIRARASPALLAVFCVLSVVTLAGVYQEQKDLPPYVGKELTKEEMNEVVSSNSPLTSYVYLSPNADFPRAGEIKKITIHHMGANLTLETLGESFGKRIGAPLLTMGLISTAMWLSMWRKKIDLGQAPMPKMITWQLPLKSRMRCLAATGRSAMRLMKPLLPCVQISAGAMVLRN